MHDNIRETLAADTLRALAQATTLDLAIAPMVIGAPAEADMAGLITGLADGIGHGYHHFSVGNSLEDHEERQLLAESLLAGDPVIVAVTAEYALDDTLLPGLLTRIEDGASNVVLLLHGRFDQVEALLALVRDRLSVHPALVPTATVVAHPSHRRHQIVGRASLDGSKCGLRFLEVEASEPYEHTVRVTVQALDGQDDDALNEALDAIIGGGGEIAARARTEDGRLVCTTEDMVSLGS